CHRDCCRKGIMQYARRNARETDSRVVHLSNNSKLGGFKGNIAAEDENAIELTAKRQTTANELILL
ncbi:hypothetical protein BaRGS_00031325, partial [Batillaria attramentaria]